MSIWQCLLCGIPIPGSALGQHFQMFHPELDWHPEHWVDGQPVVYDIMSEEPPDIRQP